MGELLLRAPVPVSPPWTFRASISSAYALRNALSGLLCFGRGCGCLELFEGVRFRDVVLIRLVTHCSSRKHPKRLLGRESMRLLICQLLTVSSCSSSVGKPSRQEVKLVSRTSDSPIGLLCVARPNRRFKWGPRDKTGVSRYATPLRGVTLYTNY